MPSGFIAGKKETVPSGFIAGKKETVPSGSVAEKKKKQCPAVSSLEKIKNMEKKKPIHHQMTRRSAAHDYSRPGTYHITLHVAEALGQPLGAIMGSLSAPDGSADAPHTVLTRVGQMVEHELLTAIHQHYPMVTIQDYVIMPEHLHFLMVVTDRIVSKNGTVRTVGDVITGFKVGCNRQYWEIMQQPKPAATVPDSVSSGSIAGSDRVSSGYIAGSDSVSSGSIAGSDRVSSGSVAGSDSVSGGSIAGSDRVSSGSIAGARQPLFAPGYCDVMPVDAAQLATQRAYIAGNPRSRLLRMSNRAALTVQRAAITTALTPAALCGYLKRVCPPSFTTAEALAAIEGRLLIATAGDKAAGHSVPGIISGAGSVSGIISGAGSVPAIISGAGSVSGIISGAGSVPGIISGAGSVSGGSVAGKVFIFCDTFGNRALLTEHCCLPVVCHHKDAARFSEQKQRCLEEAARGAVLVSACISPKEREIINESVNRGSPVITLHDNGFIDRYHPSADRLDLCAADRLLIVSPWQYQYRGKNEQITVLFCKAMNCVAQALCRTRDDWWKQPVQQQ